MIHKRTLLFFVLFASLFSCGKGSDRTPMPPDEEHLQQITFQPTKDIFPNPERGFMKLFSVNSEGTPLSLTQLTSLRNQSFSLLHREYFLEAFVDSPLSEAELNLIQTDMDHIREAGLKVILRFAYTDVGDDAPLEIVEQHIDQLQPVFEANADVIAFIQAGFIGQWGEWHNSTNGLDTYENKGLVLTKLLNAVPKSIMVQVRTPRDKQFILGNSSALPTEEAFNESDRARIGFHNDCFLTGGDEYGTYSNIDEEKKYISDEGLFVPVGGETCPPLGDFSPNCVVAVQDLKSLRWTYMNIDYYQPTLNLWRTGGCYEDIQRNLGYRLELKSALLPKEAKGNLDVNIELINQGYGSIYHEKSVFLVFKNEQTGEIKEKKVDFDIRQCLPGKLISADFSVDLSGINAGEYSLFLRVADSSETLKKRIEYSIRFANEEVWVEENKGMNSLNANIKIL